MNRIARPLSFASLAVLAALVVGCMVQPRDAATGQAVGPPLSLATAPDGSTVARATGRPVPASNPATGGPVVLVPTAQVDYDRIADAVGKQLAPALAAATPPPYQPLTQAVTGLVVAGLYELSRKREQKALVTPPPGVPPKP